MMGVILPLKTLLPPNQFLIFFQNPIGIPDIFLWLKGNLAILAFMVLMGGKSVFKGKMTPIILFT